MSDTLQVRDKLQVRPDIWWSSRAHTPCVRTSLWSAPHPGKTQVNARTGEQRKTCHLAAGSLSDFFFLRICYYQRHWSEVGGRATRGVLLWPSNRWQSPASFRRETGPYPWTRPPSGHHIVTFESHMVVAKWPSRWSVSETAKSHTYLNTLSMPLSLYFLFGPVPRKKKKKQPDALYGCVVCGVSEAEHALYS